MNEKEIWVTEDGSAPVLWRAGLVCWEGRPRALWTCFPKPRRRSQGPSYSSCSWVLFSTPKPEAPSKQKLPLAPHTNSRKALKGLEEIKGALINPDQTSSNRREVRRSQQFSLLDFHHPTLVLYCSPLRREERKHVRLLVSPEGSLVPRLCMPSFWLRFLCVFSVAWAPIITPSFVGLSAAWRCRAASSKSRGKVSLKVLAYAQMQVGERHMLRRKWAKGLLLPSCSFPSDVLWCSQPGISHGWHCVDKPHSSRTQRGVSCWTALLVLVGHL